MCKLQEAVHGDRNPRRGMVTWPCYVVLLAAVAAPIWSMATKTATRLPQNLREKPRPLLELNQNNKKADSTSVLCGVLSVESPCTSIV
jgi:hypothetical protein